MDKKTFLNMTILVISFVLLIGLFILFLSPMLGVLYFAAAAFVFTIIWLRWPKLNSVVTMELRRIRQKICNKNSEVVDVSFHPSYLLVYTRHGRNEKTIITKERFVIGRSKNCDLQISDANVSREHCQIVYQKFHQTYYLEDLNSSNGTYIGMKRLEPYTQEKLLENATLTIAGRPYRFTRIE